MRRLRSEVEGEHTLGELDLIAATPAALDALASEPEIRPKHAAFALQMLAHLLVHDEGPVRDALEAADVATRMDAFARRWNDPEHGWATTYAVGADLMQHGRLEDADRVFAAGIDAYATPTTNTPLVHLQRASIRRVDGRWPEARACLDEALAAIESLRIPADSADGLSLRASYFGFLGQLERARGLPDRAAAAFDAERDLAQRLAGEPWNDVFQLGNATQHRLDLHLQIERYEKVLADAAPVLALDIGPGARAYIELQVAKALAALEARDPERERAARGALEGVLDSGGLGELESCHAEMELAQIAIAEGRFDDARARLRSSGERLAQLDDGPELVFEIAAQRALEARLARRSHAPGDELKERLDALLAAYDAMLRTWAAQPLTPGGIGFLNIAWRREVVGEVIALSLLVPEHGPEAAVRAILLAQANGTLSRRVGATAPTLTELRETLLSGGGGLLLYHQTDEATHLLAVDAAAVVSSVLPPTYEIDRRNADLHDLVHRDPGHSSGVSDERRREDLAEVDAYAAYLRDALLPPKVLARIGRWSHVIVSDGSDVGHLPWPCLPLADGRALGLSKPLSEMPSVPFGMVLARREHARDVPFDLLLFAMPPPGPQALAIEPRLAPLPIDDATLRRLRGALPPERVRTWPGARATRTALGVAPLERAAILHLFCHGVFDDERERPAALVLAADGDASGLVDCDAVEGLVGRVPPLVILSACGAARAHDRVGEDGVTNLGGAFQYAGANTVVLASASLEYAATVALMESFTDELARGSDVGHAMLAARRAVAAEQPHPYYHSLMRVVGIGTSRPLGERR